MLVPVLSVCNPDRSDPTALAAANSRICSLLPLAASSNISSLDLPALIASNAFENCM